MWADILAQTSTELADFEAQEVTLPTYTHVTTTLVYPSTSRPLPAYVSSQPHVQCFFDGGAASKQGTGGFVVFGISGQCLTAQARFYGEEMNTNNRAEVFALKGLMEWLAGEPSVWSRPGIVVYGDSQLIINFCNR